MTHAQQIKIRLLGVDHVSKSRADAKKMMSFLNSAPQLYPKRDQISEAPN